MPNTNVYQKNNNKISDLIEQRCTIFLKTVRQRKEKRKFNKKKQYDTSGSQVVPNLTTNEALSPLSFLFRWEGDF